MDMSRHWVYVGVPKKIPDWHLDLPPECRECVYRTSEEANHYCPFPDCYVKNSRGEINMIPVKRKAKKMTMAVIIWSNIVRQQFLKDISDAELCQMLGVTSRTLYNYRHDPSVLTIKQIQTLMEKVGVGMDTLLQSEK